MKTYKCLVEKCENLFQSVVHNVRYCPSCRPILGKIKRRLEHEKNKKTCPVCLELFVPNNGTRKYCYMGGCDKFAQKVKSGYYERTYRVGKSEAKMKELGLL